MTAQYKGLGKLCLHRGVDLTSSVMVAAAFAYDHHAIHGVRLVTTDPLPGGCSVEIVLSPDAAAGLAAQLHSLAHAARFKEMHAPAAAAQGPPLRLMTA